MNVYDYTMLQDGFGATPLENILRYLFDVDSRDELMYNVENMINTNIVPQDVKEIYHSNVPLAVPLALSKI